MWNRAHEQNHNHYNINEKNGYDVSRFEVFIEYKINVLHLCSFLQTIRVLRKMTKVLPVSIKLTTSPALKLTQGSSCFAFLLCRFYFQTIIKKNVTFLQ